MAIIEVDGLVKRYGEHTAVNGVSFAVEPGEIFGILGPNGAGKTTTVEWPADRRAQPHQQNQSLLTGRRLDA